MDERTRKANGDHFADAVGTTGLFCNLTAVIAFALSVVDFVHADGSGATTATLVAVLSFAASMACFWVAARRAETRES